MSLKLSILALLALLLSSSKAQQSVTCPGTSPGACDCDNECGETACECDEGFACCGFVLCPGFLPDEFCDCGGDCTNQPTWCGCDEALSCCGFSLAPSTPPSTQPSISITPSTQPSISITPSFKPSEEETDDEDSDDEESDDEESDDEESDDEDGVVACCERGILSIFA